MSKIIVITGHGRIEPNTQIVLQKNLLTTCKFGEVHNGKFVKVNELSIFTNPNLLYEYIFSSDDYTSQGEWISYNTAIPNIVFTPLDNTQMVKNWSWQQPYVVNHFRKACIYELKNIPNNNYQHVNFTNINQITLADVGLEAKNINFFPLINRVALIDDYLGNTTNYQGQQANINGHICSVTSSTNNRVHIFDYEMGPSLGVGGALDNWNISDAITDIENFGMQSGIDLAGAESIIAKTCLSL